MVEEQIDFELLSADLKRVLTADEGEPDAQLEQELSDVLKETGLEMPFVRFGRECQEIEVVRVLKELLRQVRLRRRKRLAEVSECLPLPAVKPAFNLLSRERSGSSRSEWPARRTRLALLEP